MDAEIRKDLEAARAAGLTFTQYLYQKRKRLASQPHHPLACTRISRKAPSDVPAALPAPQPVRTLDERIELLKKTLAELEHFRSLQDEKTPTCSMILMQTAAKWRVPVEYLRSPSKMVEHVLPRQEYYWRCRHETSRSWKEIARPVGRDHTTVLHGADRYNEFVEAKAGNRLHKLKIYHKQYILDNAHLIMEPY